MRKRINPSTGEKPGLDMSSLIDVSFLLLIYFLVTSTLDPKEADLTFTLPTEKDKQSARIDLDPVKIEVNAGGQVFFNHELVDSDPEDRNLSGLFAKLVDFKLASSALNTTPLISVLADDNSKGQRFVDVLNVLGHEKIDITSVTLPQFQ